MQAIEELGDVAIQATGSRDAQNWGCERTPNLLVLSRRQRVGEGRQDSKTTKKDYLMKIGLIGGLFLMLVLSAAGCASVARPYSLAVVNQTVLRAEATPGSKVNVTVTRTGGEPTPGMCRAAGPVELPGKQTYQAYLQEAIQSELTVQGLHDAAGKQVTVELVSAEFSSTVSNGSWTFNAKVSNASGISSNVTTKHPFDASFIADRACTEVAAEFLPAAQKFIGDVFKSPAFTTAIKP